MKTLRQPFSLVELLVTAGIIAILASMLMPVLARAKEASKRTVCASQLKCLGVTTEMFADDNEGAYPTAFVKWTYGRLDWAVPSFISIAGPNYPEDPGTSNGTAGFVFEKYGMAQAMFWCPSNQFGTRAGLQFPPYQNPFASWDWANTPEKVDYCYGISWRCKMQIGYAIVSGFYDVGNDVYVRPFPGWVGQASWKTTKVATPAHKQGCERPAEKMLAADSIIWYNWWGGTSAVINHASANPLVAAYQNMLFADGHVEGRVDAKYNVQNATGTSPYVGFKTYDTSHCYFWGRAQ